MGGRYDALIWLEETAALQPLHHEGPPREPSSRPSPPVSSMVGCAPSATSSGSCWPGVGLAIGYVLAGIVAFVLIITIPFGIASFRLAGYVVWPFGRTVVVLRDAGFWSVLGNIV